MEHRGPHDHVAEARVEVSGPYQGAGGDRIWFRRDHSLNEARHAAASFAEETGDPWTRTRYIGKRDVSLHDHDNWEDCQECGRVPAWEFEIYEGTWRR